MRKTKGIKAVRPYPHYKFPHEIQIKAEKLDNDGCAWYGGQPGSYILRCINYGWFPTEALMTVTNGKFADGNNIGAVISGNCGAVSLVVKDYLKAIAMLKKQGYQIVN